MIIISPLIAYVFYDIATNPIKI